MFAPRKRSRRSRISIAPAPTSITAFVGAFAAGPEAQAVYVSSVAELEATFGSDPGDAHDAVVQFFANGGTDAWVVRGGADDLAALDGVDVINLLTLPGMCNAPSAPALAAGTAYCAARRAFFIADPPAGLASADDALAWIADPAVAAERSDLCAVYFPELVLASGGTAAPSGTLAGIYASCTAPWQAAGSGAALNGVAGLTVTISDDDSALLAAAGINGISTLSSIAVALTMSSDPESKYVSVRRLA
ncbi:MAG TPA: hypothetical protein VG323_09950, partial [Thermoanaerobaculia bacterium]|nr:hypothetical protein [Thermoanaerobaculia bacterium]